MERDPRWGAPEDEVPAFFPIGEMLAITDRTALIVAGARVYSNGVEFVIDRRLRRGSLTQREWQRAHFGASGHLEQFEPGRLRYGLALGDGQHLVLGRPVLPSPDDDASTGHSIFATGGGGGGSNRFARYEDVIWLWPLPPEGPLEVVAQWPEQGIPESRVVLDGGALRSVATQAHRVWE